MYFRNDTGHHFLSSTIGKPTQFLKANLMPVLTLSLYLLQPTDVPLISTRQNLYRTNESALCSKARKLVHRNF